MSYEDDFEPLKTYSGHPHLSSEQREMFYKEKKKNLEVINPILNNEAYRKIFGAFDDFQVWRVNDLQFPQIHPIHMLFLTIHQRLDTLVERDAELQSQKIMKHIDEDEYKKRKGLLNYYYIQVCAELDLDDKKTYKEIQKQIKNNAIDYKEIADVEPPEEPRLPAVQV
jgi:hypothetical protein